MMDWEQDGMKLNIEPETRISGKIPAKPLYHYAEEEGLWKCLYNKVLFNYQTFFLCSVMHITISPSYNSVLIMSALFGD
jgi:hypothetical protein